MAPRELPAPEPPDPFQSGCIRYVQPSPASEGHRTDPLPLERLDHTTQPETVPRTRQPGEEEGSMRSLSSHILLCPFLSLNVSRFVSLLTLSPTNGNHSISISLSLSLCMCTFYSKYISLYYVLSTQSLLFFSVICIGYFYVRRGSSVVWFGAFRPDSRMFESSSGHHVGTLSKFLAYNALQYNCICAASELGVYGKKAISKISCIVLDWIGLYCIVLYCTQCVSCF